MRPLRILPLGVFALLTAPPLHALLDTNGDGISDLWSQLYPTAGTPSADPDGDGFTNLQESLCGTNPFDSSSRFAAALPFNDSAGNLRLAWPGTAGVNYRIDASTDLVTWTPGTALFTSADSPALVRAAGSTNDRRRFWRVTVLNTDTDSDGLNDWEEAQLGTSPIDSDSDHDGLVDGWECANGLNPMVTHFSARPPESDEVLINPGKGWVLYPPFSQKSEVAWAAAATGYNRISWARVQPTGPDTYDWSALEADIAACKARGKKYAFGIMPANSSAPLVQQTPQWVFDQGARAYRGSDKGQDTGVCPVWDDPIYLKYQLQFVQALAARFDGSDDIAFIDALSYGNWGEWHLTGIGGTEISDATKKQLLDAWSAFKHTPIIVPGNTGAVQTTYGTGTLGFGISCGSSEYGPWAGAATTGDGIAPCRSEWSTGYAQLKAGTGWTKQIWSDAWIPTYMAASKYSYDNLGQWGADSNLFVQEKPELVRTWANRMGYWLKVVQAVYPRHLGNGQPGELLLTVRNDGVAPIYVNQNHSLLKLTLLDKNNQPVSTPIPLSGIHPFDWKPGAPLSSTVRYTFPVTPGAAKLGLGLFSRDDLPSPDIRFGNQGRSASGWLVLAP